MTACWPLIGASGTKHFSGLLFATGGLVIGLLCLLPWLVRRERWRALFSWKTAPNMFLMGLFSGGASAIFITALNYTTPANAAIMAQVEVLYSALLCAMLLKEKIPATQSLASLLVVTGTGMIMFHDLSTPRWKGDLMILVTPWMFQLSHIAAKRLPKGLDPITISGGRVFYGILAMAPLCLYSVLWGEARWSWEPRALAILGVQGLMMSCLNFILWYIAIFGMDLAKATAIMLSYPALTVVFSWTLGHEQITGVQLAGLVVTMTGASWVSRLVLRAQRALPDAAKLPPETAAQL